MTTPRFFIGNYNGAFGLKTATLGNDVTNTTYDNDENKRSFNSQWSNLTKVSQISSILIPSDGTWSNFALSPTLGYTPFFEMRVYDPSVRQIFDDYQYNSTTGYAWYTSGTAYATATNIYVSRIGTSPVAGKYGVVIVYQEQAI